MPGRVNVDETLAGVEVPRRILNELSAHARETLPEECCGVILGDDRERFREVVRCSNEMTRRHHDDPVRYPRDGRESYFMSPKDVLRVTKETERGDGRVTAVYHSHVDTGAYLSEMDLEYAEHAGFPFPAASQIVIAVFEGKVRSLALFERAEPGQGFTGRRIRWGAS